MAQCDASSCREALCTELQHELPYSVAVASLYILRSSSCVRRSNPSHIGSHYVQSASRGEIFCSTSTPDAGPNMSHPLYNNYGKEKVWCPCMAIHISVQYNGGLLPDIILLAQCYYRRGTRLNAIKRFVYAAYDPT